MLRFVGHGGRGVRRYVPQTRQGHYFATVSGDGDENDQRHPYLAVSHPDTKVPKTTSDLLRDHSAVTLSTYARPELLITHGKGCRVYTTAHPDRPYLDFSAGIAVTALGHGDQGLAEVLYDQATKVIHSSNLFHNQWTGEAARKLVEMTRAEGTGMGTIDGLKVFFSNSGTESNEGALKFARKFGKNQAERVGVARDKKIGFVNFTNAFHGRTMGALAATPQPKYQAPFSPLIPGFVTGEYNNADPDVLARLVTPETCGVIVEPVQGEGGIYEASAEFLQNLRKRCTEVGAALIFDEIQCGLGRTGTLWGHQSVRGEPVAPDILTLAKPLSNGVPIGAIMITPEVAEEIKVGDHGTTFGGNPLASRAACYVLDRLAQQDFKDNLNATAAAMQESLSALVGRFPSFLAGPVRGRGLILGVQIKEGVEGGPIVLAARERGLIVITAGNNTLRIIPPLVMTPDEAKEGVRKIEGALLSMQASQRQESAAEPPHETKEAMKGGGYSAETNLAS